MAQVSITIDTATDNISEVQALIARIYGNAAAIEDAEDTTDADSEGVIWDERIHSTPAKKNANGTWKKRRGVDPQLVQQVQNAQKLVDTPPTVPAAQPPAAPVLPTMPSLPAVQPPAPAAPTHYSELCGLIGRNLHDEATNPTGRINQAWVQNALSGMGVVGGVIENVAGMDEASQLTILQAFRSALGE